MMNSFKGDYVSKDNLALSKESTDPVFSSNTYVQNMLGSFRFLLEQCLQGCANLCQLEVESQG
jgi:hypothetical protein